MLTTSNSSYTGQLFKDYELSEAQWQEIIDVMEPPTAEEHPLIFRYGDAVGDWIEHNLHTS
jgi:hypothetical protein